MSQSSNELTFINGKIFTSNPEQPYASAMVVRNGRIAWIGELVKPLFQSINNN